MDNIKPIAVWLAELGVSRHELVREVGVSRRTIWLWETGRATPRHWGAIWRVANHLRIYPWQIAEVARAVGLLPPTDT